MPRNSVDLMCAVIGLAWVGAVAAQGLEEDELALAYGDKSFVTIATGSRVPVTRAPAVASAITAEDIKAIGATDLDEVLETVPGLHVSRASIRYAPTYTIRGIGGGSQTNPQVLMLQNGIPMTTMFNGDRGSAWIGVPVENIARIEVIRGPGSALYGADAFAGVINVITKTAAEIPGTEAGLRGGSFNTRNAWVQHGGKLGEMDVAAYFRVGGSDGSGEITRASGSPAPGPVSTDYDAVDGSLTLSAEKLRFRAGYKLRDNQGTGAGIAAALDPASKGRAENLTADISWTDPQWRQDWGMGATASFLYYALTYPGNVMLRPPSATPPNGLIGGPNQWERQLRLSGYLTYTGFADHNLRVGLGRDDLELYKAKTFKNYMFNAAGVPVVTGPVIDYTDIQPHIRPQRRFVTYAFAQDEWSLSRDWTLTAGVRRDQYSDFGGTTNPRLALAWEAAYDLTLKLLHGRAFRAPSFNEQYGINPVQNGNPSLRPETIATSEAALSWQARKDLHINLSAFRYDAKDLIRLVGTTFGNIGTVHGSGVEAEADWELGRNLRLSGNFSYQRSIDKTSGADAGYAPHRHAYLRADWRFAGNWLLGAQANWVAQRKRAAGDLRAEVPDYATADLTLRTEFGNRRWEFAASIRNLFDARVLEPSLAPGTAFPDDLPLPRRSFYLQATHAL
ncbi:MAG: TonB-dependent receptor [Rhodocyclales bacterium]|nr:TonB-dependent receptor [Rhodocyclales bacterium]